MCRCIYIYIYIYITLDFLSALGAVGYYYTLNPIPYRLNDTYKPETLYPEQSRVEYSIV